MGEKIRKFLQRVKIALRQKRIRIALIAILAVVVLVALIFTFVVSSPSIPIPNAPSNLVATEVSSGQIDLNWQDNSDNETGLKIERKTGAGGSYAEITTVGVDVTAYSDTGLDPNTAYSYRVRAYNGGGDSPYSNVDSATTLRATAPNAPNNLVAEGVSSGRIDLSWWDNSDNEEGFRIERKAEGGSYKLIADVGTGTVTHSDVSAILDSTTYYYRVRAYNDVGLSPYSNESSATTLEPTYHISGGSAVGSKLSVSVSSPTKTDRYCEYYSFIPHTKYCKAPLGQAFAVVSVSASNRSDAPLTVKRVDFILRDSATRDPYGLFDYETGDVGDPFPAIIELAKGETVAGVILYLVPQAASTSGMEAVYVLENEINIWQF